MEAAADRARDRRRRPGDRTGREQADGRRRHRAGEPRGHRQHRDPARRRSPYGALGAARRAADRADPRLGVVGRLVVGTQPAPGGAQRGRPVRPARPRRLGEARGRLHDDPAGRSPGGGDAPGGAAASACGGSLHRRRGRDRAGGAPSGAGPAAGRARHRDRRRPGRHRHRHQSHPHSLHRRAVVAARHRGADPRRPRAGVHGRL